MDHRPAIKRKAFELITQGVSKSPSYSKQTMDAAVSLVRGRVSTIKEDKAIETEPDKDLAAHQEGTSVSIKAGPYKGKSGRVVRSTKGILAVILSGTENPVSIDSRDVG